MGIPSKFFIDLEHAEICALERFLDRATMAFAAGVAGVSAQALESALESMRTTVYGALQQLNQDKPLSQISVAIQLLEEQADAAAAAFRRITVSELDVVLEDEEVSNDASLALWKILDVIGPIEVRL